MARAGTVTVDVEGNFDKFEKDMKRSGEKAGKLLGGSMAVALGTIAAQAVTSLARKLVDIGKEAIEFTSKLEVATMAFEQLAGDAGLALLDRLKEIAKTTPFQLEPIIQSTRLMLGYGVTAENAGKIMQVLIDNVAAFGGSEEQIGRAALAMGQVQAKGRVLGEELRQLNESGVQAQAALAVHLGITQSEVLELARKGEITVEQLNAALLSTEGPLAKNAGFAAKATDTVIGAISNLKDAWNISIAEAMLPKLRELKDAIVNELQPAIEAAAERLGPAFATGAATLADVFAKALPALVSISDAILRIGTTFGEDLMPLIEELTPLFQIFSGILESVVRAILPLIMEVLGALGGGVMTILITLLQQLMPVLMAILPPFAALAGVLLSLVELVGVQLISALGPVLVMLAEALMPVITSLVEGPFTDLVAIIVGELIPILAEILPVVVEVIGVILELAMAAIIPLVQALLPLVSAILPILADLLMIVADIFLQNKDTLLLLIDALVPIITLISQLLLIIIEVVGLALRPLIAIVAVAIQQFIGIAAAVLGFITTALEPLLDFFTSLVPNIEEGIQQMVDAVMGFVDQLANAGEEAVQGFLDGAARVAENIRSWVKRTIVDPMKRAITDFFKIGSPSKLMFGYGQDVATGFQLGMEKTGFGLPGFDEMGLEGIAAATGIGAVTVINQGPVGGSMADFAAQIEKQRAIEARFAYG